MHDISHEIASGSKSLLCGNSSLSSILLVCQYNKYRCGCEFSEPNFIGIQHGRGIVHLDDGVSSRVDEYKALSQSIRFVWPHYGPNVWIQTLKSRLEVQRTRLQSGCKVVVIPEEIPIIEESQPVNVLERRYLYTGEQRRS